MNPNTKLEEEAEQFRKDTGMTAPFKDTRDGSGWSDRHHAWNDWRLRNEIKALRAEKIQSDFAAVCIINGLKEQLSAAVSIRDLLVSELRSMVRCGSKQDWESNYPDHMADAKRAISKAGGGEIE